LIFQQNITKEQQKGQEKGDFYMKQIKWVFLIYAILSAAVIMGIGIAIAEQSIIGVLSCLVALVIIMGLGFSRKAKMRRKGEL
jgi:cell division protein FtsW (lipid II flippase)